MKNNIMLSIIVPIYNVENYVEQCIESILEQTYKQYELILVDDGSEDRSGEICDKYKKINNNIVVIHKKNGGLSDARNAGINQSSGRYLMFIDGDDFLYDNKCLEKIAKMIENTEADIIQYKMVYLYGKKFVKLRDVNDINYLSKYEALKELNKRGNISVSACDKIVKSNIIKENKLFFEKGMLSEDIKWSYNLYLFVKSIKIFNEDIYVYRQQRPGSISTSNSKKSLEDIYKIINYWLDYKYENKDIQELYYNMITYWYLIIRTKYPYKFYSKELKKNFKELDKLVLLYNQNYKVKKTYKMSKFIGINNTFYMLRIYLWLKNMGILKM